MDVYRRRRLVAIGVLATVLVLLIIVAARSCGSTDAEVGAKARSTAPVKGPEPLVADPSVKHVKQPNASSGDGPFWTVEDRTVEMRNVPNPGKKVALTFDDGPDLLTPKFLDVLKRYKVKATFFVIGIQIGEHPEMVRRAAAEGHTIANHTYRHEPLSQISSQEQKATIVRTQGMIEEAIGRKAYFFRHPQHAWSFGSMRQTAQLGLVNVHFSIDTQDWRLVGSQEIIDRSLQAKPGDVIQMHDGGPDRQQTLDALPTVIRRLKRKGFELVTLDELYRDVATGKADATPGNTAPPTQL